MSLVDREGRRPCDSALNLDEERSSFAGAGLDVETLVVVGHLFGFPAQFALGRKTASTAIRSMRSPLRVHRGFPATLAPEPLQQAGMTSAPPTIVGGIGESFLSFSSSSIDA